MSKAMGRQELSPSQRFCFPYFSCVPNNAINADSHEQRSFVASLMAAGCGGR
jgi:hypothetical protein